MYMYSAVQYRSRLGALQQQHACYGIDLAAAEKLLRGSK